jgi:cobalt/nickel transport protein
MKVVNKYFVAALSLAVLSLSSGPAVAHFQMIYTPKSAFTAEDPKKIDLKLIFTHPFEAGHTMDMGMDASGKSHAPKKFGVKTKDKDVDLLDKIKPFEFTSLTNKGTGWELKDFELKGMGDSIFYLDPGPYFEKSEDSYLQQITKVIVNRGGTPTIWHEPLGLPVEIVPLDKPYGLWTGNVFRGVVLKDGKPVPNAEIEVEFLNHAIEKNAFGKKEFVKAPQDAFVTQTMYADAQGVFTYAIPKAGWWGFAAVGAGGAMKHEGKELSLDAVIWVQAVDMK